jgi:hypothetical protein
MPTRPMQCRGPKHMALAFKSIDPCVKVHDSAELPDYDGYLQLMTFPIIIFSLGQNRALLAFYNPKDIL